jgi:NADPH:quinone reductase-like Zn-dependent oxidoreductase
MRRIPQTMRAAAIERFGGPEVLELRTLPVPEIGAGEVLIATHTAGVGSWDAEMRAGWWPEGRPRFPVVLGSDGSGQVAAIGLRVRRFRRGQRVYAYSFANPKGGFYAEYVAVAAEKVAPIPKPLGLREAGAIATTGLTALQGIEHLGLRNGEAAIVHGASGGVGTLALQFAKLRGARVLATASGRDGVALVRRLGADLAVDGKREDIEAAARRFAPAGVDAVLKSLEQCIRALRRGGRLAYPNGVEPAPRKRAGVKIVVYDAEPGVREFQRLGKAVEAAKPRIVIAASYPLGQARRAHERIEKGHVLGKIVLRIRQGTATSNR